MKKRESGRSGRPAWPGRPAAIEAVADLPPPFRLLKLRETGEAFVHAQSITSSEGAGTLVLAGRYDVVEFAAILEPEEPLSSARRVFYAGMQALTDALASMAPPERPISIAWPDAIHIDDALAGGARLAWSKGASEDAVPDWIVFGALIYVANVTRDPTTLAMTVPLEDQGFPSMQGEHLVTKFARHLMSCINAWQSVGFDDMARNYIRRLETPKGAALSIASNGDLVLTWRGPGDPERYVLRDALRRPSWIDSVDKEVQA